MVGRDRSGERDAFLDQPSSGACIGTHDGHRLWCNSTDSTGMIFATIVWVTILYALSVLIVIYVQGTFDTTSFVCLVFLIFMALWSHLRTMLGDPGAVPCNAHPTAKDSASGASISMCGRCDGYKPPMSHHDRISNRCISRMDHFCPWMNNAIGAKNQKNFFLFLIYTDAASVAMYVILALHLVDCEAIACNEFYGAGLYMVRVLIFILLFAILFTSSMILNQIYGLQTGLGTIDRYLNHYSRCLPLPLIFNRNNASLDISNLYHYNNLFCACIG